MKMMEHLTLGVVLAFSTLAQTMAGIAASPGMPMQGPGGNVPSFYVIGERGLNHRVWQKVTMQTAADGSSFSITNQAYVELSGGMHYMEDGVLKETVEVIEPFPGGAVARQGPHKVIFAPNLATAGAIDMQTAEGVRLTSHVSGLSYIDTQSGKVVVIARIKDCSGQIVGGNQVIYADAFSGVQADVRYTYKKSGIEQDVILRGQPPAPEQFGMNPDTTLLTVFSEFVNQPTPKVYTANSSGDQTLDFGSTRFTPGRAFALEAGADKIPVIKKWVVVNGRTFLFEEVPYRKALQQLQALPKGTTASIKPGDVQQFARIEDMKLPVLPAAKDRHPMPLMPAADCGPLLAMGGATSRGFVMDYATVGSALTNYTFQGDTTYYVTGPVNLVGTNYIEGGAVIKYTNYTDLGSSDANLTVGSTAQLIFQTEPYLPAVFTAKDDDTVGAVISGSTGTPDPNSRYGFAAVYFVYGQMDIDVHDVRVYDSYFGFCFAGGPARPLVRNCQFVGNTYGIYSAISATFRNLLVDQCHAGLASYDGSTVDVEHVTVDRCSYAAFDRGTFNVTNSLVAGTNLVTSTMVPTILNAVNCATNLTGATEFQTVGAGAHYLAADSPYRNAGTTNLSPAVSADLRRKTTYPPILYSNVLFTSATTLAPQALRDTGVPDLGYHYDPVDHLVFAFTVTNAPLTVASGTVVASYFDFGGICMQDGSSITASGKSGSPAVFTFYNTAQEQPIFLSTQARSNISAAILINPYHYQATMPYGAQGLFQFSKFTSLANSGNPFYQTLNNWDFSSLTLQSCELGPFNDSMRPGTNSVMTIANSLLRRMSLSIWPGNGSLVSLSNNLIWRASSLALWPNKGNFSVYNNAFDSSSLSSRILTTGVVSNDFNAYICCTGTVPLTNSGPNNVILTNALAWQTGPLGNFYQPTNSPLINAGSTNASLLGLYHYTTATDQTKEASSVVDIGLHYVAVDANGNPLDSDGDGIPDYLEDVNGNGNGADDPTSWQIYNSANGLVGSSALKVFTPLKP